MVQSGKFYIYSGKPKFQSKYASAENALYFFVYIMQRFRVLCDYFPTQYCWSQEYWQFNFPLDHFKTIRRRKLPRCPHKHPQHTIYPIFTSHPHPHWHTGTICIHASQVCIIPCSHKDHAYEDLV